MYLVQDTTWGHKFQIDLEFRSVGFSGEGKIKVNVLKQFKAWV